VRYTQWMFFRVDRCNEWSTARIGFRSTSVCDVYVIYDCVAGKILKSADDTKIY